MRIGTILIGIVAVIFFLFCGKLLQIQSELDKNETQVRIENLEKEEKTMKNETVSINKYREDQIKHCLINENLELGYVTKVEQIANWDKGERYRFHTTTEYKYIAYFENDHIVSIRTEDCTYIWRK